MTVSRTIYLQLSPEELAELFTEMDSLQQSVFFARVGSIAKDWPGAGWCQQSCDIINHADTYALEVIQTLASHLPADTLAMLAEQARR